MCCVCHPCSRLCIQLARFSHTRYTSRAVFSHSVYSSRGFLTLGVHLARFSHTRYTARAVFSHSVYSSLGFLTSAIARLLTMWVCRQQDGKYLTAVCMLVFLPLCRKCLPQQLCLPLLSASLTWDILYHIKPLKCSSNRMHHPSELKHPILCVSNNCVSKLRLFR